ncbi:two-component system response regulator HsbR [Marinobacter nanhaiticus D15-8W]|uniref:Response regulator n=1 Tax=Marinobacter nanhaiticus D15-8W TaxID=626887 RepID=N6X0R7_9GAMM|nr:SpoIIE family protein phosphatase [Marinobacter nanhaiticus]ENO17032.1 response regulator [Marinobacter nanhaiticus D15-8W]BES71972.1 two-component system response regulator HsbR [Marinobacter nanhaiticus D15-8W]
MDDADTDAQPLRILIADDSESDRLILKTMVRRQGHDVMTAADGVEAVESFRSFKPQIVLLDVMMPGMDGMEAARHIKALAGEELVPIIFLTSLSDADALARCLEAGGDDFLSKPYNRVIIEAKINAFNRMRLMHGTLSRQRDLIRDRNEQLVKEQTIARRVFDNIAHTGCLDAPNIRYHASPLSVFNGDVLFACPRPSGGMNILIGDFTGHGLPAAIGAMPVAEIFYGMTSKGFLIGDILREINQKLWRILPTDMFCCAAFLELDFHLGNLTFWNGGLPGGFLMRHNHGPLRMPSRHLPLGVVSGDRFSAEVDTAKIEEGDTVLFVTDGVPEATNAMGEMFGEARLADVLETRAEDETPLEAVLAAIRTFTGSEEIRDDLTLVSVDVVASNVLEELPLRVTQSALSGPSRWTCEYEVSGETLSHFNPLPLLLHICMEVPGLRRRSGEIYTILSELYTNALEHGVLELPSSWKSSPEGFGRYYAERERRLRSADREDAVRFRLEHETGDKGGVLKVYCSDSGSGFDYTDGGLSSLRQDGYAGRGLALLHQLCESLTHQGRGNEVEVVYRWTIDSREPPSLA